MRYLCSKILKESNRMNVVEFQSTVNNGVIVLPEQYQNRQFVSVKVIMFENPSQKTPQKKVSFTNFGLTMPVGYQFDREEANAR